MDNKIIGTISGILKSTINPETSKPFILDKEINILVKEGHVDLTININPNKLNLYDSLKEKLQKKNFINSKCFNY